DLPGQLASRDAILANNGCVTTCTRVPVNVDLADNWIEALSCAGWTPRRPTVWVAEGLLYYLPYQLCDQLVDQISLASAPRSSFVLDVPHERFLMDEYARPYRLFLERRGSPYRTALVNPRSWLLRRGWTAQAYLSHDLRAGRCPLLPPVPDRLLNYTDIWHVTARHPRRRKA
ncbi:MAG: class I SAM-dependent methyltransferase, partial [Kutzneria sp.]|nr:class I SAM-dependent methyltransferase [Kutzneria sp.]